MNSLNEVEYHNRISFYLNNEGASLLQGEVLIDKNSYCEGTVSDSNKNEYFVFGTFVKFNYLDLYVVMNNGEVYRWRATKGYLKYNGKYSKVNSGIDYDFYLKARELNVDPRDLGNDNPNLLFLEKLKVFREVWFQDEKNRNIYNSLIVGSNNLRQLHK